MVAPRIPDPMARLRELSRAVLAHAPGSYPEGLDIYGPVNLACEIIEKETGIAVFGGAEDDVAAMRLRDAYAQLCAAWAAVRFWADPNTKWVDLYKDWADLYNTTGPEEKRLIRRKFFTFVSVAYELTTCYYAGVTWSGGKFGGEFFAMAKIYSQLLPGRLRPPSDVALGKLLKHALRRRSPSLCELEQRVPKSSIKHRKPRQSLPAIHTVVYYNRKPLK